MRTAVIAFLVLALLGPPASADPPKLPLLLAEDFEKGAERWRPTDPKAWKVEDHDGGKAFHQFQNSKYAPPHRSPLNIALLKEVIVGDFVLEAKVKSAIKDYDHRDACLFFGYQGPSKFYYVHLGKKTDDRANQVFIVNEAARKKVSDKTTPGTPWDEKWHQVRIVREAASGKIEVFFDDMKAPAMTATDKTFAWGQVGLGSFDDTTLWDDVKLYGKKAEKE